MHFDDSPADAISPAQDAGPWYRGLTRYQWFVFVVASLGWLFDTMDQQLFNLARKPAVTRAAARAPSDTSRPAGRRLRAATPRRSS